MLLGCGESVVSQSGDEPDPVVVDVPIAFIKRSIPVDENGSIRENDLRRPELFFPGAGLYIKTRASVSAEVRNITDALFSATDSQDAGSERPQYDVKDLEVSYDGTRLLFALRAPEIEGLDDDEQPTWNIWEYDRTTDELTRIIRSDIVAEAGQDTAPVYLPDGRILFSSTRQRTNQAILLDEGKAQFSAVEESRSTQASVLHVMDANGENLTQVSFNQSHDLDPIVLADGKVLFSRWDRAASDKGIHLYRMNPDGSDLEVLYGRHSHDFNGRSQNFVQSRITPDGQVLVALRDYRNDRLGGDFALLDVNSYIDTHTPIAGNDSLTGPAQVAALFDNVDTEADLSPGGYFASVYPLWDGSGRQLFAWSQCRVQDSSASSTGADKYLPCSDVDVSDERYTAAPLLYGLWMYDPASETQQVIALPEEGLAYTEVVSMEPRPYPADYTAEQLDAELMAENLGVLHVKSIYDLDGDDTSPFGLAATSDPSQTSPSQRRARFVRVTKSVSIPQRDVQEVPNIAFGPNRNLLMRDVIGYAPIEPDGSVWIEVPANVPLAISLLDENGKRISQRHDNWLQVIPGEVKTCNGCHTVNSTVPHGRLDAENPSINQGAALNGSPFPGANPEIFADYGDTMAQARARVLGDSYVTADVVFEDVWTDPAQTQPAEAIRLAYADLQTPLPISQSCAQNWTSLCRITINFPEHIQPLFDLPRMVTDENGLEVADHTCVSCHNSMDADGNTQVPAAQLELTSRPSSNDPKLMTSYRELLYSDNEQEIVDGLLVDRLVVVTDEDGNPLYELDENGELILDESGNPIERTSTVNLSQPATVRGAEASFRLFRVLETGSHAGWMTPAEQRLLAEWLDIGAQYYNNPFDVPQD
ncbi:hypothetical protein DXV75_04255 [Alteromonas aestuariivivens]|uniref:Hydrazine synthase alpha subunit middle domain-containing protein n=2 Tax=Alteromonas aestuariivivens TaxID=1938339 RepID=A0A3D8MCJ9_9ALTE|nr:hypothetical protein DXV75_04255 [Alteromonas aestuariivivens]